MSLSLPSLTYADELDLQTDQLAKIKEAAKERTEQKNSNKEVYLQGIHPIQVEAINFYDSVKGKSFEELSPSELAEMRKVNCNIRILINSLEESNDDGLSIMQYQESDLSKAIEATLNSTSGLVTFGDIAIALGNANTARDIGVTYAQLNGWYPQTWDNPADAYRHFAWNFFNTEDMNASKARIFGDNHELSLIGARLAADFPGSLDDKVGYVLLQIYDIHEDTQGSLTEFNKWFDNSSVMDILNNQMGRNYYSIWNYNNVADAFYDAFFEDEALIGYPSEISSSKRQLAWYYWQ